MQSLNKHYMVHFFKEFICKDLDNDISTRILGIIARSYAIEDITHSIYDIVKVNNDLAVIIQVKCYDYKLKKKVKGYFALEYFYIAGRYRAVGLYSRSMPMEIKAAAKVPYGGWFKDARQAEDEKRATGGG